MLTRHGDLADTSPVPRFTNEIEVLNFLGHDSWRNLKKDDVIRLLETLPDVDPEVALKIIAQVPEITKLAKVVVEDALKAHDAALASNARSQEMLHERDRQILEIFSAQLDKDLTPEQWTRVVDEIRDVNVNARSKDTENKGFISTLFQQKLGLTGGALLTFAAVVFVAARQSSAR